MLRHPLGTLSLMFLVASLSGCAALSQLGPKYKRDSVDDFHDKAMEIQGVFTEANADLLRIRGRLVAMVDDVRLVEARNAVRDAKSVLGRLTKLPARGKELLGIGQALVTKAPAQYMGPQVLHLPQKLMLLKEAIGILAGLGDQVTSLTDSGKVVIGCGSALISGGDRSPCEDTSLAELDTQTDVETSGDTSDEAALPATAAALRDPYADPAGASVAGSAAQGPASPAGPATVSKEERIRRLKVAAEESPDRFLEKQEGLIRRAAEDGDTERLLSQLREALSVMPGAKRMIPWAGLALARLGRLPVGLSWLNHDETTDRYLRDARKHYNGKPPPRVRVTFAGVPEDEELIAELTQTTHAMRAKYERSPKKFEEANPASRRDAEWLVQHADLPAVEVVKRQPAPGEAQLAFELTFSALDPTFPNLELSVDLAEFGFERVTASISQSAKPPLELRLPLERATMVDIEGLAAGDRVLVGKRPLTRIKSGAFVLPGGSSEIRVLRAGSMAKLPVQAARGERVKLSLPAFVRVTSKLSVATFDLGPKHGIELRGDKPRTYLLPAGELITLVGHSPGREAYRLQLTPEPGQNIAVELTPLNLPLTALNVSLITARGRGRTLNWWGGALAVSAVVAGALSIQESDAALAADTEFQNAFTVETMEQHRTQRDEAAELASTWSTVGIGVGIVGAGLLAWGTSLLLSHPEPEFAADAPLGGDVSWTLYPWFNGPNAGAGVILEID
jgi:hypothetical protein